MRFIRRKFYWFTAPMLCFILFQVYASAQTPTPTPEEKTPSVEEKSQAANSQTQNANSENQPAKPKQKTGINLVHFGDLIDVDVLGSTEYDWRGSLNPEGFLNGINFVEEPIYGLCRTEEEIAQDVAKGFSKLLRNPQVVVKIIDRSGRPFSVLFGAVKTSQRFQIQRQVRLNELLILSGGITEKASGEIQILRPPNMSCEASKPDDTENESLKAENKEKFIPASQNADSQFINIKISDLLKGKPEANPFIYSGDTITVKEAESVYVIGGVGNPKQVIATPQLTVSRAIAAAGGFTKDADPKKITIFRREKEGTKLIEVNFEKIDASPEEDIVLQPLDIVDVARRGSEKRKFPPVINVIENSQGKNANPPLKIID